ncbi:hypothetical protein Patl1_19864 [Pistacia atlantica]|uniref:Uncharacterized protein n=1 Tax=Pistacia atlantica TaxID=434234 RepID=A0ACC1BIG7_9ROSI|nr:hypothetical protein Patl1_19864 [Pistacia atlantica]
MLENQLPFFILEDFIHDTHINVSSNKYEKLSLLEITRGLTKLRWGYLGIEESLDESKYSKVDHLVDFLRCSIVPSKSIEKDREEILTTSPSVTKLHQAGVKFKLGSSKNLFDIRFKNGILEIPRITICSPMKYVVKNMLAFEKSQSEVHLLNHYFILIRCLAKTPKNVELLVQHEIIHNRLGDGEQMSSIFIALLNGLLSISILHIFTFLYWWKS